MPDAEYHRLQAVRRFEAINLDRNKELQDIVILAAEICQVPIALITLLDENDQWIKVRTGTDQKQVPRAISFCTHLIQQEGVMVVTDALSDNRFLNNPLVAGDPGVRFYAGAALNSADGHKVGSLCVIGQEPQYYH